MWMFASDINNSVRICVILAVLCSVIPSVLTGCGGLIEFSGSETYTISTSSSYEPYSYCVWVVIATSDYRVKATFNFTGQAISGSCVDWMSIKDGSSSSSDIFSQSCGTHTNQEVTSSQRWMWIEFQADGDVTTAGLTAILTTTSGVTNGTNPRKKCKAHEYSCSNSECIVLAYKCDGFNDCGCDDKCDEQGCSGLPFDKYTGMGIGAGIGGGSFILIYIAVWVHERRRRNAAKRKEKFEKMKEELARHGGRMPKEDPKGGKSKKGKKKDVYWHR